MQSILKHLMFLILPLMGSVAFAGGLHNLNTFDMSGEADNDTVIHCTITFKNKVFFNGDCIYRPVGHGVYVINVNEQADLFDGLNGLYLYQREWHSTNQIGITAFSDRKNSIWEDTYALSKDKSCLIKNQKKICLSGDVTDSLW